MCNHLNGAAPASPVNPYHAWRDRAKDLAHWTWDHLVNRVDVWGGYGPLMTYPALRDRGRVTLTPFLLERHFRGAHRKQVIGTHSTSIDNTCKWGGIDLDNHDDSRDVTANNLRAALGWYERLRGLGFRPLLTESNGAGGYHLRIILSEPVPAPRMYQFLQALTDDHATHGIAYRPETFPKQASIDPDKGKGNWLRLPGHHHSRDHWSRVWDGERFVDSDAAIDYMLSLTGDAPDLIPPLPEPSHSDQATLRPPATPERTFSRVGRPAIGLTPCDDFDMRGPGWLDILGPGWKSAGSDAWTRPGKDTGASATTSCRGARGEELLYVFTSNAPPFEPGRAYGKSRALAVLSYGGDLSATALALAAQGYGAANASARTAAIIDRVLAGDVPSPAAPTFDPAEFAGERLAKTAEQHAEESAAEQRHRDRRGRRFCPMPIPILCSRQGTTDRPPAIMAKKVPCRHLTCEVCGEVKRDEMIDNIDGTVRVWSLANSDKPLYAWTCPMLDWKRVSRAMRRRRRRGKDVHYTALRNPETGSRWVISTMEPPATLRTEVTTLTPEQAVEASRQAVMDLPAAKGRVWSATKWAPKLEQPERTTDCESIGKHDCSDEFFRQRVEAHGGQVRSYQSGRRYATRGMVGELPARVNLDKLIDELRQGDEFYREPRPAPPLDLSDLAGRPFVVDLSAVPQSA